MTQTKGDQANDVAERRDTADEIAGFAKPVNQFADDDFREINSFEDLQAFLAANPDVLNANVSAFGTGYSVIEDKSRLVGVDLAILDWKVFAGDSGAFIGASVLTRSGEKWIVNDGSFKSGIMEQLIRIANMSGGKTMVLRCPKGLRVSEYLYDTTDQQGNPVQRPAKTYYIDI